MFRWPYTRPETRFVQGCRAFAKGQYVGAISAWKDASDKGHAEAAVRLGDIFFEGVGVLRSLADAKHWYGVAAERGVARAQLRVAELCLVDDKAPRAVKADSPIAALCPHGVALQRDDVMARHWARAAAEQGESSAQALLGYLLSSGHGGERDYKEAEYWYRQAAKDGVAHAQLGLGTLLAGHYLGEPAYAEAFECFTKAAEQGLARAKFFLGVFHKQGLGVPIDSALATRCFREAAESGSIEGQRELGRAYLAEDGLTTDRIAAEAWLLRSARGGDVEAMVCLGDLYSSEAESPVDAMEWYRAAAKRGHERARLVVASMEARDECTRDGVARTAS